MRKNLRLKTFGLSLLAVFAFLFVLPSLHIVPKEMVKSLPFKKEVNLGLDLQGGIYLAYHVDIEKALFQTLNTQIESLQAALEKTSLSLKKESQSAGATPTAIMTGNAESINSAKDQIKKDFPYLMVISEPDGKLEVGLSFNYTLDFKKNVLDQSVRVVRNRVDEFGVAEASISTKGADKIVVELPGVKDVNQAKDLIGQTAKLEFRLVDEDSTHKVLGANLVGEIEKENNLQFSGTVKLSEFTDKINQLAKGKIPETSEILFERPEGAARENAALTPYVLFKNVPVSGSDLSDARVSMNRDYNTPQVDFRLKPDGARRFGELTGANVQKRLAIVLDNTVKSAPVINSKITDSGVITLGRGSDYNAQMKEAQNLAIVLRAGALPANLELQEQRVVGPTLGQDSIRYGVFAGILGCCMIFVFMTAYYRISGFIATVSLIFNLMLSFMILIALGATLTLPGIAGLALVIGMGVDSNVLIFERMRDELLEGASPNLAVEHGFSRAFTAIFDANITHGIVGVILYNFGTGPLKGFAVTLLIGIVTTLFCAITVCRVMFAHYLATQPKTLSV